jgi:hypothetical protein
VLNNWLGSFGGLGGFSTPNSSSSSSSSAAIDGDGSSGDGCSSSSSRRAHWGVFTDRAVEA